LVFLKKFGRSFLLGEEIHRIGVILKIGLLTWGALGALQEGKCLPHVLEQHFS
jgi:hypothetical protein